MSVCDSMNALYLLAEEMAIVSISVKVCYCACLYSLQRSLNVSLEEYFHGKADWKSSFRVKRGDMMSVKGTDVRP